MSRVPFNLHPRWRSLAYSALIMATILVALIIVFSLLAIIVGGKFPPARVWQFLVPLISIIASGIDCDTAIAGVHIKKAAPFW